MPKTPPAELAPERIQDIDLETEMQGSFLEYAYSVIYSRAVSYTHLTLPTTPYV